MSHSGFSSWMAYCGRTRHRTDIAGGACPNFNLVFDTTTAPNGSNQSSKMRYARAVSYSKASVSARVKTTFTCKN